MLESDVILNTNNKGSSKFEELLLLITKMDKYPLILK